MHENTSTTRTRRVALAASVAIAVAAAAGVVIGLLTQQIVNGIMAGLLVALVGAVWVRRVECSGGAQTAREPYRGDRGATLE